MTNDAKGTGVAPRRRAPAKAIKAAAPHPRKVAAAPPLPPPGWYPDPVAPDTTRYWDGEGWTGEAESTQDTDAHRDPATVATTAGRISFHGRSMRVYGLSVEQIGVWRRIARQFETVSEPLPRNATKEMRETRQKHLQRALDRALDMVMSVLVDEPDQEWIETQLLTNKITLQQAIRVISLTIEDFTARNSTGDGADGPGNRAQRRAADTKARRRA